MSLNLNLPVKDIMNKEIFFIHQDALVEEAAALMVKNHINGLPVCDDNGDIVGMITQGDLLIKATGIRIFTLWPHGSYESSQEMMKEYSKMIGTRVKEVMNDQPITIHPDRPVFYAAEIMYKQRVKQLPVVEEKKLVGFIERITIVELLFKKEE